MIDIENFRSSIRKPLLSEIADDTWFIKLETKPECLIGRIKSIKKAGDNILISNAGKEYLLFDTLGSFISKVGRKGKGPGEYIQIFGTAVDPINDHIFFLDNGRQKIIEYNEVGQYLQEVDNNYGATEIEVVNGALIQFTAARFANVYDDYHLHFEDTEKNNLKSWHKRSLKQTIAYIKETVYRLGDEMAYWQMHWDTIYGFNGANFYPKYYLKQGKKQLPDIFLTEKPRTRPYTDRDPYISVFKPIEFESFMFIDIIDLKRRHKLITYNKHSQTGYCIEWNREVQEWGFVDDISGIPIFSPDFMYSDNEAACVFEVYDLKSYNEKDLIDGRSANLTRHQELLKIIQVSDIMDNPIIQIARFK